MTLGFILILSLFLIAFDRVNKLCTFSLLQLLLKALFATTGSSELDYSQTCCTHETQFIIPKIVSVLLLAVVFQV